MPAWPDLHPFIVHFPVALLTTAVVFLVWGALVRRPSATGAAWSGVVLVLLGTLGLVLALSSGEAGEGRVPRDAAVQEELHEHEEHAEAARLPIFLAALGFLVLQLRGGLSRPGRVATAIRVILFAVYGFGLFQVLDAAHHGGRLVHVHGVHVDMDG